MPPTSRAFAQSSGATSAYARHLQAASAYVSYYGGTIPTSAKYRNERDILEDHHQFIRTDEEADTEEKRIAKSYYDKLFKEFAMVELARWREKQIAMRWRTKQEVLDGKGQFSCANLSCRNHRSTLDENPDEEGGLRSVELNFEYAERGEKKHALVTARVCEECADKLRYVQRGDKSKRKRSRGSRSPSRGRHHRGRSEGGEESRRRSESPRGRRRRLDPPTRRDDSRRRRRRHHERD
ncbi:folate-sensitive fragile site protein Fra10Ac1-domain-containing protein [Tuber indicum]|nr:folate-sensitive fragile site protein Fra10Ac1-domain-containing protein [Tuber indicum]